MPPLNELPEMSSELVVELKGSQVPRLWTSPLRDLTPETSYGFEVVEFARDVLHRPLDPWQEWLVIHAGELLEDGRPRFRTVLVLVARQNGKTELLVILALYWLFICGVRLVLGTSTNLDYARESWEKAVDLAEGCEVLAEDIPTNGVRRANGEQTLTALYEDFDDESDEPTRHKCRYKIAASNRKGGRSLTIDRLVLDELREHHDWTAWNAATPATNAVRNAQIWAISNQGDDRSVVLDSLRSSALERIDTDDATGGDRLGLFEWSAPDGSRPTDLAALAQANPNLGHRLDVEGLLGDARRAEANGGEELAGFLTEILCMRVPMLDPAIDGTAWAACLNVGVLDQARGRVALCVDVSIDQQHASLVAAAVLAGKVRVEVVAAWSGPGCTAAMRRELPGLVRKIRPRKIGWFPKGPAAAIAAEMAEKKTGDRDTAWPPRGVEVTEIGSDVPAVCMGFAELVKSQEVVHSDDPLLNAQVTGAEKLHQGDAWRFTRRGAGHCDATYGAAGAVHIARTMPPPPARMFVVSPDASPE